MRGDKSRPHTLCSPLQSSPHFHPLFFTHCYLIPFSFFLFFLLSPVLLFSFNPPRCHPRSTLVVFLCTAWLLIITHSLFLWLMALLEGDPAPYGRQAASVMASAICFLPFHMCLVCLVCVIQKGTSGSTRDFSSTRFSGNSSSRPALYLINMINHGVYRFYKCVETKRRIFTPVSNQNQLSKQYFNKERSVNKGSVYYNR